ncbi:MAG: hypothetical protein HQK62_08415 [Desulfamplus sp.]|nr:hypothetical protein [Desulfamplus sp.]
MVLEREIRHPSHSEPENEKPKYLPIQNPIPMVKRICIGVPNRAIFRTGFNSLIENSSPRAKRSSATPISARSSIS